MKAEPSVIIRVTWIPSVKKWAVTCSPVVNGHERPAVITEWADTTAHIDAATRRTMARRVADALCELLPL